MRCNRYRLVSTGGRRRRLALASIRIRRYRRPRFESTVRRPPRRVAPRRRRHCDERSRRWGSTLRLRPVVAVPSSVQPRTRTHRSVRRRDRVSAGPSRRRSRPLSGAVRRRRVGPVVARALWDRDRTAAVSPRWVPSRLIDRLLEKIAMTCLPVRTLAVAPNRRFGPRRPERPRPRSR